MAFKFITRCYNSFLTININFNRKMVSTLPKLDFNPEDIWNSLPELPYTMTNKDEIEKYFKENKTPIRSALPLKPTYFNVLTVDDYNEINQEFSSNSPFIARVKNDETTIGAVKLNPFIFNTPTRSDVLFEAYEWERRKGLIDRELVRNPYEMLWSKKKCWPQKGSGRAAISHRGSSLFPDGGKATGKRPKDLTIKIPDQKLRYAYRSILATRYREGNLMLFEEFTFKLKLPDDENSLIVDTQIDDNYQFFNEDLNSINKTRYTTCFDAKIKDFCKHPKLFMTLRALDMYDKLLKFDSIPFNHPNYDAFSYDFEVVKHFMGKLLKTPPKRKFKNAIIFKDDFHCQLSRKYVPSDASRRLFQERLELIDDRRKQLWFTYRRSKYYKKSRVLRE